LNDLTAPKELGKKVFLCFYCCFVRAFFFFFFFLFVLFSYFPFLCLLTSFVSILQRKNEEEETDFYSVLSIERVVDLYEYDERKQKHVKTRTYVCVLWDGEDPSGNPWPLTWESKDNLAYDSASSDINKLKELQESLEDEGDVYCKCFWAKLGKTSDYWTPFVPGDSFKNHFGDQEVHNWNFILEEDPNRQMKRDEWNRRSRAADAKKQAMQEFVAADNDISVQNLDHQNFLSVIDARVEMNTKEAAEDSNQRTPKSISSLDYEAALMQALVLVNSAKTVEELQKESLAAILDASAKDFDQIGLKCFQLQNYHLRKSDPSGGYEDSRYDLQIRCQYCQTCVSVLGGEKLCWKDGCWSHGEKLKLVFHSLRRHEGTCSTARAQESVRSSNRIVKPNLQQGLQGGKFASFTKLKNGDLVSFKNLMGECKNSVPVASTIWKNCIRKSFNAFIASQAEPKQLAQRKRLEATLVKCFMLYLESRFCFEYLYVQSLVVPKSASALAKETNLDSMEEEKKPKDSDVDLVFMHLLPTNVMFDLSLDFGAISYHEWEQKLGHLYEDLKQREKTSDGGRYNFRDQSFTQKQAELEELTLKKAGTRASQEGDARDPATVKTHMVQHVEFINYLLSEKRGHPSQLLPAHRMSLVNTLMSRARIESRGEKSQRLFARHKEFVAHRSLMFLFMETLKAKYLQFSEVYAGICQGLYQELGKSKPEASPLSAVPHRGATKGETSFHLLRKMLFEDSALVEQHLTAFQIVVLLEVGCQRPQVLHNCVYLQMLLREQFLSQTSEAFVSEIVEVDDGVFHLVICGDKVKNYAKPFSVPISLNGAAVCRVFVLLHQYWREWYLERNLPFPSLAGASADESILFSPMFLSRSGKDRKKPLKHVPYDRSFAQLQEFLIGGKKIEGLADLTQRKAKEIRSEVVDDRKDQEEMDPDEECFLDDEDEDIELLDAPKSKELEGHSNNSGNHFDASTRVIVKELYQQHFYPAAQQPIWGAASPVGEAGRDLVERGINQAVREFFSFASNHRQLRVTYVQYKSHVFADHPDKLGQLSHLQRHGSEIEETDYSPYRAELFSRKAKEFLGQQFGQTNAHNPPDIVMESVAQHLIRMKVVQPVPSPQAWEAIREIGRPNGAPQQNPAVLLNNLAQQNKYWVDILLQKQGSNRNLQTEMKICVPRPTFVLGILPVFLLSQTIVVKCSGCKATCFWYDLNEDRIKEEADYISTKLSLDSSYLKSRLLSSGINLSHMVVCPFRKDSPKCALQVAFVTNESMTFTVGGTNRPPPELLVRTFLMLE
jgi:hypothetical protein